MNASHDNSGLRCIRLYRGGGKKTNFFDKDRVMKNPKVRNWRHLGENDSKVIKVWQLSSFSLLSAACGVCCVPLLAHCLKWAQWFAGSVLDQNKVVNAAVYCICVWVCVCVCLCHPTPSTLRPLHMPIQTPYRFHNAPYHVKPLIPIQTQHRLFPFQSALTVIEFTITLSRRGNFASQPISLAPCFFYTVPGCESWVNNESVSTPPPTTLLPTTPLVLRDPGGSRSVGCPALDRWSAAVSTTSSCFVQGWTTRGIPAEMCFT